MRRLGFSVAILAVSVALLAAPVLACGFDGIPSVSGNGILARLNTQQDTNATLSHWAPFVFPTSYHKGRSIKLSENLAEVRASSLLPEAFGPLGRPFRWEFSDGSSPANGFVVRHSYRKAGVYKVRVFVYYPSKQSWLEFDDVLLRVR